MKILAILIALLFFGLLLGLWTRDFFRLLMAGQLGVSNLPPSGTARGAATVGEPAMQRMQRLSRTSPAYLAFILGMAAVLAGSTYVLTGDRSQSLFFGVAIVILGFWRKLRLVIMLGLSQKWLPRPPAGAFASEKDRVEWDRRQADMAPKSLLRAAMVIFASDMLLVAVVLVVALALRGS